MTWMNVSDLVRANPPTRKEIAQGMEFRRRNAKVSFYADENFPSKATQILKTLRARVTTARDEGLRRHPDENHAAYALKHGFVLLTCDRDYLDESRFPLVHCPAIVVFNFGSGSLHEIRQSFACLTTMLGIPQFYDKWVKIDAKPDCWTQYARYLNGTTSRARYRVHRGQLQEWVEDSPTGSPSA
jgi:predicted nuclease of predicted toxin-antitoxin system